MRGSCKKASEEIFGLLKGVESEPWHQRFPSEKKKKDSVKKKRERGGIKQVKQDPSGPSLFAQKDAGVELPKHSGEMKPTHLNVCRIKKKARPPQEKRSKDPRGTNTSPFGGKETKKGLREPPGKRL